MSPPDDDDSSWSPEPEEFDPTSVEPDAFDPTSVEPDAFDLDESGIDIPEAPDPTENDVPPGVRRTFWLIVLMANLGLLALSVGVMIVVFRGQLRFGGSLVVLGLLALLVGYFRYRNHRNR